MTGVDDVADLLIHSIAVEWDELVAHPLDDVLVVWMLLVSDRLQDGGVAVDTATFLRRAGAFAINAAGSVSTGAEPLDVVLPSVAEVIQIDERVRQIGQRRPGLVPLVWIRVLVGETVTTITGNELVQVTVRPAQRDLQDLVQSVKPNRGRHIEQPLYRGRDTT